MKIDKHRAWVATQETITILGWLLSFVCVIAVIFGLIWVIFNFSTVLGLCSLFVLFVALIWYACYN